MKRRRIRNVALDCIVKIDSSLSNPYYGTLIKKLDSIVKFDSSLSKKPVKWRIYVLECIVKFDSSLAGVDFKNE